MDVAKTTNRSVFRHHGQGWEPDGSGEYGRKLCRRSQDPFGVR